MNAPSRHVTLHKKILGDIERRIVSGAWPPGHRLPFETELAESYGCSRMTVNKVMSQLAKAGLIERRRKSGSFVIQPKAQSAVLEIHDIRAEVASLNLPYRFVVVAREQRLADATDIKRLDVQTGAPILAIDGVHYAGDAPFCLEQRLISLESVPEAAEADFADGSPGGWLLGRVPWSTAEHRIHAAGASAQTARHLHLRKDTACLVVERRTWNGTRPVHPVTYVRLVYAGDRHTLVATFEPASG